MGTIVVITTVPEGTFGGPQAIPTGVLTALGATIRMWIRN